MKHSQIALLGFPLLVLIGASCAGTPRNRKVADDVAPIGPAPTTLDTAGGVSAGDSTDGLGGSPEAAPAEVAAAAGQAEEAGTAKSSAAAEPNGARTGNVAWPRTIDGADGVTVATVAGRDVKLSDLVSKWMLRDPDGVRAILDDLILSQIVTFESAALQIEVPPGSIEKEVELRIKALSEMAKKAGAPDLETYVRGRLGLEPQMLVKELEQEAAVDLLAPRCVRAWLMASDRREIRAIAVADKAGADAVQARLAAGDTFEDVARDLSIDASKEDGGRMPPVVRGEQPLARTAFASGVGEVAGPIADGSGFVFVSVEAAPKTIEGAWGVVGGPVEASLVERGVENPEFWQWKDAMFRRYEIDITPFLDLADH